jgi:hypothetical protein
MLTLLKQHLWLFIALFLIPLFWNIGIWQLSILELARNTEFGLLFPNVPVRLCLLIKAMTLGCTGGLVSLLFAIIVFNIFPKWTQFSKYAALYAVCWLIPFCLASLFGFAMAAGAPGMTSVRTPVQALEDGLFAFTLLGTMAGCAGIFVFISLQIAISGTKP